METPTKDWRRKVAWPLIPQDLLLDVVNSERGRYDLTKPFVANGRIHGTNGRVLIFAPSDLPDTTDREIPDLSVVLDISDLIFDTRPILLVRSSTPCALCAGHGFTREEEEEECEVCYGAGYLDCCECGQEVACQDCKTSGVIKSGNLLDAERCARCEGQGATMAFTRRQDDEWYWSQRCELTELFLCHPGATWAASGDGRLFVRAGELTLLVMGFCDGPIPGAQLVKVLGGASSQEADN